MKLLYQLATKGFSKGAVDYVMHVYKVRMMYCYKTLSLLNEEDTRKVGVA